MKPSRPRRLLHAATALAGRLATAAAPLLLAACALGGPRATDLPPSLFADARFSAPREPLDASHVFDLSPAMQAYLHDEILPSARKLGARQALLDALYTRSKLQLEYDATLTRDAAQAFDARMGNCLSLVIMTGAFAKAMDLGVRFQQVTTEEMWSRAADMYFLSGHVNLQLEASLARATPGFDRWGTFTVDFLPSGDSVGLHVHTIAERTILAMYMNNRAAEAMVAGQLDDAYWRAREAIRQDPGFAGAFNTLGVVYLRHGDADPAARVLAFAAERAPDNPRILANYAEALQSLGRDGEAAAARARVAQLEPYPPFYFFNRGQAALQAGDLRAARGFFRQELARAPDYHEFHYWLAVADFGLGDLDDAHKQLSIALEDSVRHSDRALYAAKLDKVNALRAAARVQ